MCILPKRTGGVPMAYADGSTPNENDTVRHIASGRVYHVSDVRLNFATTPGHDVISAASEDRAEQVANAMADEYELIARAGHRADLPEG